MANIMDYLDWRGDLTMSQSAFNEVDNLILAQLSYVYFENIVPGIESEESISVKEASDLFFAKHKEAEIKAIVSMGKMAAFVMKKMAKCQRFANLKISKYVNKIDYDEQKQFSAINITLDDDSIYVSYRGTDDTIVGWKEDFNMSFMTPVPAQIEAVKYLEKTVGGINRKIRVGGHSKGGNLAVYAAVKCCPTIKENIIEVYNNDGPGFDKEIIVSIEYREMRAKIKTIVPQTSVVGMLLEHEEEYIIVKSNQKLMMQHDAMSWEVLGKQFAYVDRITETSKIFSVILKAWVNKMEVSQREQLVDSLFYIFDATDVKSLGDLVHDKWRKVAAIRKVLRDMEPENKEVISKAIRLLFKEGSRALMYRNRTSELN